MEKKKNSKHFRIYYLSPFNLNRNCVVHNIRNCLSQRLSIAIRCSLSTLTLHISCKKEDSRGKIFSPTTDFEPVIAVLVYFSVPTWPSYNKQFSHLPSVLVFIFVGAGRGSISLVRTEVTTTSVGHNQVC